MSNLSRFKPQLLCLDPVEMVLHYCARHLFCNCPFTRDCYNALNLLAKFNNCANGASNFAELMFNIFYSFSDEEACKFVWAWMLFGVAEMIRFGRVHPF